MSWFLFTRDVSANLLQLRQNDPFSVQKLGHILNLTQIVENFGVICLFIFLIIYIKAHKS